jgi:hypothetical protein
MIGGLIMSLLQTLARLLPGTCQHPYTYRERRKLHGAQVMHFVCERCGHATPAVQRTAREHRRVVKVGHQKNTKIVRQPGRVLSVTVHATRKPA